MIIIAYSDPNKWPVTLDSAADCDPKLATADVRCVTCSGEELCLVKVEFSGLPMPKYPADWYEGTGIIWWWTDALFIISNIQQAKLLNDKAGKAR